MAKVDFYADIVETGSVLGIDANLPPDVATAALGRDYGENLFHPNYWKSFGFLEIFWEVRPEGRGYSGHHFTFQAHRLGRVPAKHIPKPIRARHGLTPFKKPLHFTDLKAELDRRGVELVETWRDEDYQRYLQPETGIQILVLISNDYYDTDELGTIPKISSSQSYYSPGRDSARQAKLLQELLSDAEPTDHQKSLQQAWQTFDDGVRADALRPAYAAIERAGAVTYLEDWQPERYAAGRDLLPSASELVADCLGELPDIRELTLTNKNLIDAAAAHRHKLEASALRDELDGWVGYRRHRALIGLPD
ncbi:hypothetical protein HPO96_00040 [Kribbella sandramycini]|uniref:Uncharacterized protein n=1 Tax=Kribbella sandramycini TaxID=60450 RepID=A0A7Y4KTW4_9ACTN|nr:hypothetical protein [Kribbella sandramycini]MBB6568793.1 hypothetical protein [Kribbella sandramycini]NOL38625.1 hypothetical protein [Kribbella sandramycini]